jgi:feruloyl esterase
LATWGGEQPLGIASDHFKYVVFKDPGWDFRTFDFERGRGPRRAERCRYDQRDRPEPEAVLRSRWKALAVSRVGGSSDLARPQRAVLHPVAEALGGSKNIHDSYRLFMVPGMAHCGDGEGPNRFDMVSTLEQWVERGKAPERIEASRMRDGKIDRTRPLCPYPQIATYDGKGDPNSAASFVCKAPNRVGSLDEQLLDTLAVFLFRVRRLPRVSSFSAATGSLDGRRYSSATSRHASRPARGANAPRSV